MHEFGEIKGHLDRVTQELIQIKKLIIRLEVKDKQKMKISEKYRKSVNEFARRALEKYGDKIDSIILFGSVARGEAREESDIDVLIVTKKEDFRLRRVLVGLAFDILLETRENISVKTLSKEDFERHKKFSFLRNVISEGVKVV